MAGIYVHIPFCKQACTYCNFHFSTSLQQKDALIAAILEEIRLQKDYFEGAPIDTIYFGGGTPSILKVDEIKRLLEAIITSFRMDELKECSLEANPDDLSTNYLRELKTSAIDRLSIGIQSFREEDLRYMHRAHTAQQSDYALKAAQDAGFSNLSIDLIYGTPGLTDQDWKANIHQMASLEIPHFSAYALTVEEGTALYHAIHKKAATPVDAAQSAGQAQILMDIAPQLGYEQYEISNFAKPGCYAIHNTSYWQGSPYLGIGPAAHSFNGRDIRQWNVANNALYIQSLKNGQIPFEQEQLSWEQQMNEYVMTSLRTQWGLSLEKVYSKWGEEQRKRITIKAESYLLSGKMQEKDQVLKLTNEGKLFADGIAADLFQ